MLQAMIDASQEQPHESPVTNTPGGVRNTPVPSTPVPSTPAPTPGLTTQTPVPKTPEPVANTIQINIDALELIGKTNAELRRINGNRGNSNVIDGLPLVSYVEQNVLHPLTFALDVAHDVFMDFVLNDNPNRDLSVNVWPDDSTIFLIALWGEHINHVFRTDGPITLEALSKVLQPQLPGLTHWPYSDDEPGWGFDVWTCMFSFDCYEMYGVFTREGAEFILIDMEIWEGFT